MDEKRQYVRHPIELAASFGGPDDLVLKEASVINASYGGFCFLAERKLRTGEEIRVAVETADSDVTEVMALVAWQRPADSAGQYETGVHIELKSGAAYQKLVHFLADKFED